MEQQKNSPLNDPNIPSDNLPRFHAAKSWHSRGLHVIPVDRHSHLPTVEKTAWLKELSPQTIEAHWAQHPNDLIASVLPRGIVQLVTHDRESERALQTIVDCCCVFDTASMQIGPSCLHLYRLTFNANLNGKDLGDEAPGRIEVKAAGSLALLPVDIDEVITIDQTVVDLIHDHNQTKQRSKQAAMDTATSRSEAVIDSETVSAQHLNVEGLKGDQPESLPEDKPLGVATDSAHEPMTGKAMVTPSLTPAMPAATPAVAKGATVKANPLVSHSLRDRYTELEGQTADENAVLGDIALMGQATVIYAKPNTGKTLLTLRMIMDAIEAKRIDPENVMYLNMDDHANGLLEKIQIASMWRFHILAEGHAGFEAKKFVAKMKEMIDTDTARGVILILDTLKMFVDTMHKGRTRAFTQLVRKFVLKGGTVVALSHTNKKQGADGKSIYSGTSDVVDDFDAAYFLTEVQTEDGVRTVMFENFKRRGNVAPTAAYTYSTVQSTSYSDLLVSITPVDAAQLQPLQQAVEQRSDADIIEIIKGCIQEGMHAKMALVKESSQRGKVSMRAAQAVLEKYIGSDPGTHLWNFEVKARGEKFFTLLAAESPQASD